MNHLEETYNPQTHLKLLRAGYALNSEQAKEVIWAIFAVMATGTLISRDFIVQQFERKYAAHLAKRRADQFILVNTDIEHWSRFIVQEDGDGHTTYGWHPEQIRHWNR